MYKIFYISFSLIIIITLLYNNYDYSLNPIIETLNEELGKIKKFKEQQIKEFDNLIYNYLKIINIIKNSNIEIEKINKENERLKSEMNKN